MRKLSFLCLSVLTVVIVNAQKFIAEGRRALAVPPVITQGVKQSVIEIESTWEINMNPDTNSWKDNSNSDNWQKVIVPGEPAMQGFKVKHDKPFFYRKWISIPADARDKTVLIRFNGVYSYAKVWVNGNFLREHYGGFTSWECDITKFIKAGEKAIIHVSVIDMKDDISYASGYAHHPIGGILRSVQLMVLPKQYINRLYVDTEFNNELTSASLRFNIAVNESLPGSRLWLQLYDAKGIPAWSKPQLINLNEKNNTELRATFAALTLWNAERPYLYTLTARLYHNDVMLEQIEQPIGFRKVEVKNEMVLVNGRPVKLRGACRHDINPLLGRSTHRKQDSLDVVLAKEANLNFIRTSHYPPSKDFIEFCDRFGIYVEEETAVCFVHNGRGIQYKEFGETQNDTAYTSRYIGQLSEMIDRDRNHASILIWSIGNESNYGINFQKEYDFVKEIEPTRPVSWTYPITAFKENKVCFDIVNIHYPFYGGSDSANGLKVVGFQYPGYPLINDEWAHVACYNLEMLRYDPNVKDFWGRGLDLMWANRFDVPGNLGGAIWGMIDELFYLKDSVTGYGPWGFIDIWRRKKAEFWNVKKAYSPIRILQTHFKNISGNKLRIPIKNRFDHTILDRIKLKVTMNDEETLILLPALAPHQEGIINFNINKSSKGYAIFEFVDEYNNIVDKEKITWVDRQLEQTDNRSTAIWDISRSEYVTRAQNGAIDIEIDNKSGSLSKASVAGREIISGKINVAVNMPEKYNTSKETGEVFSGNYRAKTVVVNVEDESVIVVNTNGELDKYPVEMTSRFYPNGAIVVQYTIDSVPAKTWQVGLRFPVSSELNGIAWKREGYWSIYPKDHLSAEEGTANLFSDIIEGYRQKPSGSIAQSMYDYYLNHTNLESKAKMPATESYRATKENIYTYEVYSKQPGMGKIMLTSDGTQAAKMNLTAAGGQELLVLDRWAYWGLAWGNYEGEENASSKISGSISLQLTK